MSHTESEPRFRDLAGIGCGLALVGALLTPGTARAQQEVPGVSDFPLIKRYEGSRLIGYESRGFDSFKLLLNKLELGETRQPAFGKAKEVKGRHIRLLYLAPSRRSSLEVFRNHERELAAKSFSALFKCSSEDECGSFGTELHRVLHPPTGALQNNELSKVA